MNESCLTFIHTLSPLHAGTGQGVGVIDLPIAREKATNLPFLPGSTLKGTLRDVCEIDKRDNIFGKGGDADGKSGAAIFSDQKLLCLPVRSLFGTFAWVTSPFILERFKRDCQIIQSSNDENKKLPNNPQIQIDEKNEKAFCIVTNSSKLIYSEDLVILEDLDLTIQEKSDDWADILSRKIFAKDIDWQSLFKQRFCIVSDDVMNFLAETATEITARNELKENKTSNNLWYEESLPTETILSGVLATVKNGNDIDVVGTVKDLCEKPIQLGGNMTVGRGLCRVIIANGGEK